MSSATNPGLEAFSVIRKNNFSEHRSYYRIETVEYDIRKVVT
jgi:hypothetical protein